MRIDWPYFIAAILLLLVPSGIFHGRHVRYRPLQRQWGDAHWREVLTLGLHTIDFVRAALGAWLLVEAVTQAPEAKGLWRHGVLLSHAALLWVGVVLQAVVCREPESMNAPFAFVGGAVLTYFLLPFSAAASFVGVFALVLSSAVALGLRSGATFFPVLAVALGAIGYLLKGKGAVLPIAIGVVMAGLPWLLTLLFSRQFVIAYRSRRNGSAHSPIPSGSEA